MYSFSEFTCSLNELEEGVAPTDCRFRPDQRFMEQQDFDKANEEKVYNVACSVNTLGLTHRKIETYFTKYMYMTLYNV